MPTVCQGPCEKDRVCSRVIKSRHALHAWYLIITYDTRAFQPREASWQFSYCRIHITHNRSAQVCSPSGHHQRRNGMCTLHLRSSTGEKAEGQLEYAIFRGLHLSGRVCKDKPSKHKCKRPVMANSPQPALQC